MTSPYPQGEFPWYCLTDHVDFDGSTGFKIRPTSQIDSRRKAFARFAHVLASRIVDAVEAQLSHLPKPNASRDAWRDVGVDEHALFPVAFMDAFDASMSTSTDNKKYLHLQWWERHVSPYWEQLPHNSHDVQFILTILTKPANPFRHLAPLIYLAQHPRVVVRDLIILENSGQYPDPDLRSFAFFTMSYYLLLNLVLALDSGASFDKGTSRASLFHSRFRHSRPLSVPFGHKDPHTAFWYSTPPAHYSPNLRAEYNLRCFHLLVALYAIMKETTLKDIALGEGRHPSACDRGTLVDIICEALKTISSGAFSDSEPSLVGESPAILVHDPALIITRGQSRFVELPIEVHQSCIYSFLPDGLQSLVNLAATCKRLREIYTPLIYADPFPCPAIRTEDIWRLEGRSSAFTALLSSKPHLASHIRRLRVCVEGEQSLSVIAMRKYNYPPLHFCLMDSLTDLVELHLYVPGTCQDCTLEWMRDDSVEVACHHRTVDAITAVTRRWPNLKSLSLCSLEVSMTHSSESSTISSPMRDASIPHHLEKLSIIDDDFRATIVSWTTQEALLKASSQTLRHLVLRHQQKTIHGLPAFPLLERLELNTGLPTIKDICLLLQKSFSSVRYLSLRNISPLVGTPGLTMDLSGILKDLKHLSVAIVSTSNPLARLILPPSVVTLQMHYYHANYPAITVSGSPSLKALSSDGEDYVATRSVCDLFPATSSEEYSTTFRSLQSFELRRVARRDDLPRLGEIIATLLPQLEVLILKIPAFSNRPRRDDYPMDDGLDDVQKAAAVRLFEKCPGLNTVSFNGVPDVWDPIGRFPARVWTRDPGDGGARMTGRAALPWKLAEVWGSTYVD